jgi:hypothetical protein
MTETESTEQEPATEEPMTFAELVRRGIIRDLGAQEREQESYERALASLRKHGP